MFSHGNSPTFPSVVFPHRDVPPCIPPRGELDGIATMVLEAVGGEGIVIGPRDHQPRYEVSLQELCERDTLW